MILGCQDKSSRRMYEEVILEGNMFRKLPKSLDLKERGTGIYRYNLLCLRLVIFFLWETIRPEGGEKVGRSVR